MAKTRLKPGPPALISSDQIVIQRKVDAVGNVITVYLGRGGNELGLQRSQSIQKADAGWIPPPSWASERERRYRRPLFV